MGLLQWWQEREEWVQAVGQGLGRGSCCPNPSLVGSGSTTQCLRLPKFTWHTIKKEQRGKHFLPKGHFPQSI